MCVSRAILILGICLSLSAVGFPIKKLEINGYDVYLVNTHYGNAMALTVHVPVGSSFDEPSRHAGRAHLFEHIIHAGSTKFPGHHTLDKKHKEIGTSYNAYTADERIYYHHYMHPEAFESAAEVLGAMLSAPEWNQETFEDERATVMNEAMDYQGRDLIVMANGIFLELLPEGHDLAMYDVGTQAQLKAMTLDDLKQLYYANYQATSVSVVIAANFDDTSSASAMSEERVRQALSQYFLGPDISQDPHQFRLTEEPSGDKQFQSIATDGARFVEFGTPNDTRTLKLIFEADGQYVLEHSEKLETLTDYLNLENSGGLEDRLKQLGWVTSSAIYWTTTNNRTLLNFSCSLTEQGAKNRWKIPEVLFSVLHDIQEKGIGEQALSYLRMRNIQSYQDLIRKPKQVAEHVARNFKYRRDPLTVLDFERRYGKVSQEELQQAVRRNFSPKRMLAGYLGPEIESDQKSKVFERPVNRIHAPDLTERYDTILQQGGEEHLSLEIGNVELSFRDKPTANKKQAPRLLDYSSPQSQLVLEENHEHARGGVHLKLRLPRLTPDQQTVFSIWSRSFRLRHMAELDYLFSMGISLSASMGSGGSLIISADGNSGAVLEAVHWYFSALLNYTPDEAVFNQAKNSLLKGLEHERQSFSGSLAYTTAAQLISHRVVVEPERKALIEQTTRDKFLSLQSTLFQTGSFQIAAVGDFTQTQLTEFAGKMESLVPKPLESSLSSAVALNFPIQFWQPLADSKAEEELALARAFMGPTAPDDRTLAALNLLSSSVREHTFSQNRPLGYVQGFTHLTYSRQKYLLWYGQVEGWENLEKLKNSWQQIFTLVQKKKLSENFEAERLGLIRALQIISASEKALASELFQDAFVAGELGRNERFQQLIREVPTELVYELGNTHLSTQNYLEVVASRTLPEQHCPGILTEGLEARTQLESGPVMTFE